MKQLIFFILFSFLLLSKIFGQNLQEDNVFSGRLILSLNGGLTIAKTDYTNDKIGLAGIFNTEYFFPIKANHIFGLRGFYGVESLSGEDPLHTPPKFTNDISFAGGGIAYSYSINNQFFPYVFAGISNLWFQTSDSLGSHNTNANTYDVEVGARVPLKDFLSINIGLAFHFTSSDYLDNKHAGVNSDFYAVGLLGISFHLLGEKDSDGDKVADSKDMCPDTPPGIKVDQDGCPIDSDLDGIPDYLDKCPNTRKGARVNSSGCPDSDFDGVYDNADKCPNTPLGTPVDESGCPEGETEAGKKDSDSDGVIDEADKCPGTPLGTLVNKDGCPDTIKTIQNKIDTTQNKNINEPVEPKEYSPSTRKITIAADFVFDAGKSEIKPQALGVLDKISKFFSKDIWTKWRIDVYTDNKGPEDQLKLSSLDRARVLVDYFVSKGLPSFQFRMDGKGSGNPVAGNSTETGRAKNRRIEIVKIEE
ncbi:MAG TPA: OmpA family protein [Ignavibacteriaceae bacterium]|nr:OmpA family protein [Ignavibacteriaceae bacterium]